jgi:hypothetical protein
MSDNEENSKENKIENDSDLKNADEYVGDIGKSDKTIKEASTSALKKITDSVYNLASYKSAEAAVYVIDSLSMVSLGIQEVDKETRDEIIRRLREKGIVLREISSDPEVQEIVRETSKSVAKIIEIFIQGTREPLTNLTQKTFNQLKGSILSSMDEMADFGKNIVKIIPGVGDAYIIIDNVLSTAKVATNVARDNAMIIQNMLDTGKDLQERLTIPLQSETLNVTDQINKFKEAQARISKKIEDAGDTISNQIYPYPKSKEEPEKNKLKKEKMDGGKKLKINYKKINKNKTKGILKSKGKKKTKKNVRFNV